MKRVFEVAKEQELYRLKEAVLNSEIGMFEMLRAKMTDKTLAWDDEWTGVRVAPLKGATSLTTASAYLCRKGEFAL